MKAILFRKSIPRYLALRAIGPRWKAAYSGPLGMISLCDMPEPTLPSEAWVRVRPTLSGVCGSDLATIGCKGSPYLSPLTSTPFVLGHEVVGRIVDGGSSVDGFSVGDRVVLQPALGCAVRGIEPSCDACSNGQIALCGNVMRGCIPAGIQTGYCAEIGGGWGEQLVAHRSQLYRVPDGIDEAIAVLCEPLACAVHGVLRSRILRGESSSRATVLVMGCGSIGLLTIATIRALHADTRIVTMAKHGRQGELAREMGATDVCDWHGDTKQRYRALSDAIGVELHQPEIGKPTVIGGADVVFDCVASSTSIDDCCRFTRAGGEMMLVGMPAIPSGIDWTSIWYKELDVRAAYAYGQETIDGRNVTTFAAALDLMPRLADRLQLLVGKPYPLVRYRDAIRAAMGGTSRSVKTVFFVG